MDNKELYRKICVCYSIADILFQHTSVVFGPYEYLAKLRSELFGLKLYFKERLKNEKKI